MTILTHALLMPEEIVQRYAALVSGEHYLENLRVRIDELTWEGKRLADQERNLLEKAVRFGFSEERVREKVEEVRSRLAWLAEERSIVEADLKRAQEKSQTVTWMWDRCHSLFYHRKELREWWEEKATTSQRHRLLRALIDPDRGGRILVYPPPPDHVPDPVLLDFWGGTVECQFKFDPNRLIETLETLGVMDSNANKSGNKKRGESKKVAPEDFG